MNFSNDRDLIILEPNLFRDLPFLSQQRFKSQGASLTAGQLACESADFAAMDVTTGDIVLVNDQPLEVLARVDSTTLDVSHIRARPSDTAIPPQNESNATVIIRTFAPQRTLVHDLLLRKIGLDPDSHEHTPGVDAIVSKAIMVELETLGTLEHLYTAAQSLTGDNQMVMTKAEQYGYAFRRAWIEARIDIDDNAVGTADRKHQPAIATLKRG